MPAWSFAAFGVLASSVAAMATPSGAAAADNNTALLFLDGARLASWSGLQVWRPPPAFTWPVRAGRVLTVR